MMVRGRGRGRGGRGKFVPIQQQQNALPRDSKPTSSRDGLYCSYCKVELASQKLYNDHVRAAVHKQKEILIGKALSDGLHFCYTCEKIFPSKIELDAHCLMTRHQPLYRVEEFHNSNDESLMPNNNKNTQPDNHMTVNVRNKGIVMDLNKLGNDKHASNTDNKSNREQSKAFYCDLCDVDCLNQGNYKMHTESWRHRAEVDKKREEREQRDIEAGEKMKTPSHLIEKANYFCEVCSVPLKNEKDYFDHLRTRRHMRQVGSLRRPFRCYICNMETSVEKDFNYHLESKSHIGKAFKSIESPSKTRKEEDWVEKKRSSDSKSHSDRRRDTSKDSRDKRSSDSTDRHGNRQSRRDEKVSAPTPTVDDRRVEIVKTPLAEGPVADLREKLKSQKIVITKPNDQEKKQPVEDTKQNVEDNPNKANEIQGQSDLDKRAKEMEFEAKFRKLEKEYANDAMAFQVRLKSDREEDISKYQHYESAYNRLCREEDYIREDLRVLEEGDPRKEAYIRDMIKVQQEMRDVRQELEIREMMIIKRETLFREKFPENRDKEVVVKPNESNDHGKQAQQQEKPPETQKPDVVPQSEDDLRIQLERERLLKRLGPELGAIDPAIKEKLLAAIFDKDAPQKLPAASDAKKEAPKDMVKDEKRENQMKYLTEREKQLEKELADLKSSASQKKKFTTSLVPQYDDVDEKKEKKKSRVRNRSESGRSSSSSSSGSDSSDDSRSRKKDRKRRRGSPSSSKSRSKTKQRSHSPERRKKRHRSSSRERDKRKKRREDKRSKSDRSKSDRRSKSSRYKDEKEGGKAITVIGGNSSSVSEPKSQAPPLSRYQQVLKDQQREQESSNVQQQPPSSFNNVPRRESNSFWKNPIKAAQGGSVNSPKEDVWDIAFSGGNVKGPEKEETLNLFNTEQAAANFSQDIINILRNVAPAIQPANIPEKKGFLENQPLNRHHMSNPRNLYEQDMYNAPHSRSAPLLVRSEQNIGPPMKHPERPSFNSNLRNEFPISQSMRGDNESEKGKIFPIRIPEEVPTKDKSFTTSTPLPRSGAGGRVRSILKKMKNPPAPVEEETSFDKSIPSEAAGSMIPGLDTLADKERRKDGKDERPFDEPPYDNRREDNRKEDNREENRRENIYGGKDVSAQRSYGENVASDYRQHDYREKKNWHSYENRRDDERNVHPVARDNLVEPRAPGNPLSEKDLGSPFGRRYPPPVEVPKREGKPDDFPRKDFDAPPKKVSVASTDDRTFSPRPLGDGRQVSSLDKRSDDANLKPADVNRRPDGSGVDLFPPVRMESESNASYDERYRIYLELKRRKEDEERMRISVGSRTPLAESLHSSMKRPVNHPRPDGPPTSPPEDEYYRERENIRRSDERMLRDDYRDSPSRPYERPPFVRAEEYTRDVPRSTYSGDVKRIQDERVRGGDEGRDQVMRRVEDTSAFMEDKMRDRRPYDMREPGVPRHDPHRDTFFRREVPTYRENPYTYPSRSQPPPVHDQRRPLRYADEPYDHRRPIRHSDEPVARGYRDRSPQRESYGRPVERDPYSYQNY